MIVKIKTLIEVEAGPYVVSPGDTVTVQFTDQQGVTVDLATAPITKHHIINNAMVFEFKDEFGMTDGIGAVAGWKGREL